MKKNTARKRLEKLRRKLWLISFANLLEIHRGFWEIGASDDAKYIAEINARKETTANRKASIDFILDAEFVYLTNSDDCEFSLIHRF